VRHLISLKERSREELLTILEMAKKLKMMRQGGVTISSLAQKTLIMLFEKSSTRTRLSFETAMTELGGHATYLDARSSQLSLAEFEDEIRAIMCFGHVLMFRALKAENVLKAASFNQIPVIDGCSEKYHPAQALGDMLTMIECAGGLQNIKRVAWLGTENNVSNTLKLLCAKLGVKIVIASPIFDTTSVDPELNVMASETGMVEYTPDVGDALHGADFVHTDTWVSMEFFENGKIKPEFVERFESVKKILMPYQLNAHAVDAYTRGAKIMHCMPCHVGYEITRDAIDHPNSVIFQQAKNRLHVQKAMLMWLMHEWI